jgi:hypothetical protein
MRKLVRIAIEVIIKFTPARTPTYYVIVLVFTNSTSVNRFNSFNDNDYKRT